MYQWVLKIRQPMGVKSGIIETDTNDVAAAEALGKWYVEKNCPGPGYRYIGVEAAVLCRTEDMTAVPVVAPDDDSPVRISGRDGGVPDEATRARAKAAPAGRIGA